MISELEQFYKDRLHLNHIIGVLKNVGVDYCRLSYNKHGGYMLYINDHTILSDDYLSPGELVKLIDCFISGYLYKQVQQLRGIRF